MKKQVNIFITDLGQDGVSENAVGTYIKKESQHYLFYEKKDLQTQRMLPQRIVVSLDKVELVRNGQQPGKLTLIPGECTRYQLELPYGVMELACDTKYIETELTASGGTVNMCYDMFLNNEYIERHKVKISWNSYNEN